MPLQNKNIYMSTKYNNGMSSNFFPGESSIIAPPLPARVPSPPYHDPPGSASGVCPIQHNPKSKFIPLHVVHAATPAPHCMSP